MIVIRWQAPLRPTKEQAVMIFRAEDLNPREEILSKEEVYPEHRHPFDEVRMILEGELSMNINGNQLLLRAGDKIMIPSNTKHSQKVISDVPCLCVVANRPF
ncbi:MAG: cupin domain-containing protein [Bdellovibrionales bacterium]|nr:cupin domain-containing protein [Bdellovibrionales bacterium]